MMKFLLAILVMISAQISSAAVWTATNSWSPTWEKKFEEWVRTEWNVEYFSRKTLPNGQSNPYYGLKMDCADTVYSMRVVFAFENKLPFVIQDPTTTGKTISHNMSRWDGQREIDRVKSFLWYLYGVISTRSLPNDTFPIALTKDWVKPGSLILTTTKNHHSWTVKEILPIGVPWLVYNSVVGRYSSLTLKQRQSWPNPDWVFEGNYTPNGNAGFRYWRPVEFINKPVWQTPGYSEEQYKIGLKGWQKFATQRLATRKETDNQMLNRLFATACEGLTGRVPAVNEALQFLGSSGGKCMDYPTYDTYSTPNRDRRVFDDLLSLRRAYRDMLVLNGAKDVDPQLKAQMDKIFPQTSISALTEAKNMPEQSVTATSACVVEYMSGQKMDMAEFKRRLFLGRISNNPLDDAAQRWGLASAPSARANKCQSWDIWTPDFTGE